jgi:hypothetical protein
MPDPVTDPALAAVWRRYRECAAFARRHQATNNKWRLSALGLTILGSVLAAAADQFKRLEPAAATSHFTIDVILGVLSALALALAALIAQRLLAAKEANNWVIARAVGEALKSEAFRYAAGVAPYADPTSRANALLDQQGKIELPAAALALPTVAPDDAVRRLPNTPLSAQDYVATRAGEQEAWYRDNADRHRKLRGRWEAAGLTLAIIAVVIGAVRTFFDDRFVAGWLAVLGSVGAAIAAHVAAQRHRAIEDGYRAAANGLRQRLDRWKALPAVDRDSEPTRSALVAACEGVMRTENGAWMAEWMEAQATPAGAQPPAAQH